MSDLNPAMQGRPRPPVVTDASELTHSTGPTERIDVGSPERSEPAARTATPESMPTSGATQPTGSTPLPDSTSALGLTEEAEPPESGDRTEIIPRTGSRAPRQHESALSRGASSSRRALVVLVGIVALAVAFIILVFVNVTNASINALAVIAAPIASMVAAYYGITLSIQQIKSERAEKERAVARAEAAEVASRETEVWAAQMESGLRVAMAKLNAAGVNTDEVTKAAGTPADFF
jgi:hypothetical protein